MQISTPNENDVYPDGASETVAILGRSNASIDFALCDDGKYPYSINLLYSYGGFCSPIFASQTPYSSQDAARTAGLEELLRKWPSGSHGEPQSVLDELGELRRQIEAKLRQPSLF
jgi:hypothetical protein